MGLGSGGAAGSSGTRVSRRAADEQRKGRAHEWMKGQNRVRGRPGRGQRAGGLGSCRVPWEVMNGGDTGVGPMCVWWEKGRAHAEARRWSLCSWVPAVAEEWELALRRSGGHWSPQD